MKKKSLLTITSIFSIFILLSFAQANYNTSAIDKIKPTLNDIPHGFMIGKIPKGAKHLFKNNPLLLDQKSITRLSKSSSKIYPNADYKKISKIHMTIMANKRKPYSDDIVCFIFLYKNKKSARVEINKLNEFARYNSDRVIILSKNNMAIYLHVDDINDFHLLRSISEIMKTKLQGI